jgi:hypothetical protein
MNATALIAAWNLDFTRKRRSNTRRFMRHRWLDYLPRGRGNHAWKRLDAQQRADAWHTITLADLIP